MKISSRPRELFILIGLALFTTLFAVIMVDFSIAPFEDAAILMRYAEHFAQGHGIVWNIGEHPVDGATDFLFMIVLGSFVKAGLTVEFSARFIGFLSHIFTVWIVYLALRRRFEAPTWAAVGSALFLSAGTGLYYVAAYFGTPFFALFISLSWYFALKLIVEHDNKFTPVLFAVFSLLAGLTRPEGVILTGLILCSIVFVKGFRHARGVIIWFSSIFLILGGAYFLWRWQYFGFPLPNPFYKKGGGSLYIGSLIASIVNVIKHGLPFLPAIILGFYSKKSSKLSAGVLIPIIGFTAAFVLISNEMNFGGRFQYAILPLILMIWWPLAKPFIQGFQVQDVEKINHRKKVTLRIIFGFIGLSLFGYQAIISRATYHQDGRLAVAKILSKYEAENYTLATTEAGLLPLYSRWRSIDTWGLNDQWIAHNGTVTEAYYESIQPEIIMFHALCSPITPCEDTAWPWHETVITSINYAEKNGYVLAASYGETPFNTHYYYVKTGFDESEEIIKKIRETPYLWFGSGRVAVNYALFERKGENYVEENP